MRRIGLAATLLLALAGPALADPFADDLSRCLVASTSDEDQHVLAAWMFAALSLNPLVANEVTLTKADRDAANQGFAVLSIRLLTKDCRPQAIAALKTDGNAAIGGAFQTLGTVSGRLLMSDPKVAANMAAITEAYRTSSAMQSLLKDSGQLQ